MLFQQQSTPRFREAKVKNLLAYCFKEYFGCADLFSFRDIKQWVFLCCLEAALLFWKPIEANLCQQKIPAQFIADARISIGLHLSYILTIFSLKWYSGHAAFSNWNRREVAACPFCSMFWVEFWRILFPGKFWGFQKSAVKKSSNTQKHRELQLTVFLGFQAACVLSGIFWADKPFWHGF